MYSEVFNTRAAQRLQKIGFDSVMPGIAQGVLGIRKGECWMVPPIVVLIMEVEFDWCFK
jgi:hypothetical protein